jgi:hypothetical protein
VSQGSVGRPSLVPIAAPRAALADRVLDVGGRGPAADWTEDAMVRRRVAALVLDGALGVRAGRRLLTGPAALPAMTPFLPSLPTPRGPAARMARAALRYAACLPPIGPAALADRLYRYHTVPARPGVDLDLRFDPPASRSGWRLRTQAGDPWTTLDRGAARPGRWKLYLSPHPADLARFLDRLLPALARTAVLSIKVGATPATAYRPDRCMAYFADLEGLNGAVRVLAPVLEREPGLGVPFTASLGRSGVLSWGRDPLPAAGSAASWRASITAVLGHSIHVAVTRPAPDVDPVDYALLRLALEPIDPVRFTPDPADR